MCFRVLILLDPSVIFSMANHSITEIPSSYGFRNTSLSQKMNFLSVWLFLLSFCRLLDTGMPLETINFIQNGLSLHSIWPKKSFFKLKSLKSFLEMYTIYFKI